MADSSMRETILDAAEVRVRTGGFHGFSFRDVAADVGIKSASVHYHFPTKSDLVAAVAERYTDKARDRLTPPSSPAEAIERVAGLFRDALLVEDQMCLCGILGAERDAVPDAVAAGTASYFTLLADYLRDAWPNAAGTLKPETAIASFEGALILARNLGDPSILEAVIDDVAQSAS